MTKPFVAVLMGSDSDFPVMQTTLEVLKSFDIAVEVKVTSAHRTPAATHQYVTDAEARGCKVFICAAGLAAMFPGLPATDVDEPGGLPAVLTSALSHSGPAVVSIECSADEIPPFAPFLAALDPGAGNHITAPEEVHAHVPASA